jgi:hypothetical protein
MNKLLSKFDFMPEEIESEKEFNQVLNYLLDLSLSAPNYILIYEYILGMLNQIDPTAEIDQLKSELEYRKIRASHVVAQQDDIYKQLVPWAYHENRPLIRGLVLAADKLWESGQLPAAQDLLNKIYKTNPNDNIGARYSIKAITEGMSYHEFTNRFTYTERGANFFKTEELLNWYEQK